MEIIDAHVCIGQGKHLQLSVDDLLRQMDEADVALAIACPVDHFLAVHNREGNDLVLAAVRAHPDRLSGMASVNPWFGEAAVQEARRAMSEGLRGLFLHPVYQGFRLSDPIVNPLLEAAVEFDAPVYAHTGTAGIAEPLQLADLARLFPSLNFIMGHAGASDYYSDAVRALEFADNLWLETSRNGPANYALFKASNRLDRLVFGSSAPEYIPAVEIEIVKDIITDPAARSSIFADAIRKVTKGRLSP